MLSTLFTNILLLLSILNLSAAVPGPKPSLAQVQARQVSVTPSQAELCLDYERTANMSTIGANGTYRTVLLQKSSTGTIYNARMMDAAIAKLPKLTADTILNTACGNWTAIAMREAERNFTLGVVAQFTTEGLPVGIKAGPEVLGIVGAIATLLSIVALDAVHTWSRETRNEKMDSFKNLRPDPEKYHRETPWLSEQLLMQTFEYPKPPMLQANTLLEKYSTHQISYEADALNA
ncbi:hypothetical protein SLS59_009670 [Nothophoma quercina]|uniref:Uncharacterized protein n=1 Tax=Nothophoma quercina TaxID=749835 RepID=A0ABR3QKU1_9PLEO